MCVLLVGGVRAEGEQEGFGRGSEEDQGVSTAYQLKYLIMYCCECCMKY